MHHPRDHDLSLSLSYYSTIVHIHTHHTQSAGQPASQQLKNTLLRSFPHLISFGPVPISPSRTGTLIHRESRTAGRVRPTSQSSGDHAGRYDHCTLYTPSTPTIPYHTIPYHTSMNVSRPRNEKITSVDERRKSQPNPEVSARFLKFPEKNKSQPTHTMSAVCCHEQSE